MVTIDNWTCYFVLGPVTLKHMIYAHLQVKYTSTYYSDDYISKLDWNAC